MQAVLWIRRCSEEGWLVKDLGTVVLPVQRFTHGPVSLVSGLGLFTVTSFLEDGNSICFFPVIRDFPIIVDVKFA